jgi:hypothetical protein
MLHGEELFKHVRATKVEDLASFEVPDCVPAVCGVAAIAQQQRIEQYGDEVSVCHSINQRLVKPSAG